MQITGNIVVVCPLKSGVSQQGKEWQSLDFVVEVPGQYPKRVVLNLFGQDKINQLNPQVGEQNVTVDFDIDAHEYNGRWFNQIRAWNINRQGQQGYQQPPQGGYQQGGQQWGANNPAAGAQAAAQAQQQAMRSAVPNGQPAPPNAQGDSSDLPF